MSSQQTDLTNRFEEFFRTFYRDGIATFAQHYPNERTSFEIDWSDLNKFDPDIADDYRSHPSQIRPYAEEALRLYDLPIDISLDNARVRVTNLPASSKHYVGEYNPNDSRGTLRGIIGQVSKRTQKQLRMVDACFECLRCGTLEQVPQTDSDELQYPAQCPSCEREGPFQVDQGQSVLENYQRLRLQVPPEKSTGSDASFDVSLSGDLVGQVEAGDRIIANAEVEIAPKKQGGKPTPIFEIRGEGESIEQQEATMEDVNVGRYLDRIEEVASQSEPMTEIVDSIAPSHYGDDLIKEALALQLFGGITATLPDGSKKRGTGHIFLVGDPGCDKSGLLRYAAMLEPRSVYTVGKTSSAAGLTASAVRDDFGDGQWTLEAGAIVEAHKGLASIDELDKMDPDDQNGLYEAMSDQTVSVSKAGITATLPAETKILAAANPEMGRFDHYTPIGEQIDLDPVLLSRFDLIFTMTDQPDADDDRKLAAQLNDVAEIGQRAARGDDLSGDEAHVTPAIEPEVLRAYIAHARGIIPVLTEDAKQLIEDEYVEIRMANDGEDDAPIPTTARDVTAMHRLCEAAARIRLSETIEPRDVKRALRIRRACLADIGLDPETGEWDIDGIEAGATKSQRDRIKSIKALIRELQEKHTDKPGAPLEELQDRVTGQGMEWSKAEHEIENLRDKGEAYTPDKDHLRLV